MKCHVQVQKPSQDQVQFHLPPFPLFSLSKKQVFGGIPKTSEAFESNQWRFFSAGSPSKVNEDCTGIEIENIYVF